jgi:hypothetical protein
MRRTDGDDVSTAWRTIRSGDHSNCSSIRRPSISNESRSEAADQARFLNRLAIFDRPPKVSLPGVTTPVQLIGTLGRVMTQRYCKLCGKIFEIERKRGHPREYCFVCSPPGWQVVKVRRRHKLRRRPSLYSVL